MRTRRGATVFAVALLLAACASGPNGPDGSADPDDPRLRVVVTLNILADFAAEVGGDLVAVNALVGLGADPHVHEPTPSDAVAVSRADVVLGNGLGLEVWLDQLLAPADRDAVLVADRLETDGPDVGILRDERGRPDPHLWMDPVLAAGYVDAIADAFVEADPGNADAYRDNAGAYRDRLGTLDGELAEELAAIPDERRRLVTSHDAYSYFARRYDLEVAGTVLGVSTESEPSAQHVSELISMIRRQGVPVVFFETTVNPSVVERVARDAGVELGDPLYGDSLGEPGSGAETYVDMMRHNAAAIRAGLTRNG